MAPPAVVFAWGANAHGQCCTGPEGSATESRPRCANACLARALGPATPIASVACGEAHTLILTAYGDVFACGRAREGQLGLGPYCAAGETARQPSVIDALRRWHVAHVACGSKHSVAITRDGGAFEWGLLLPTDRGAGDEAWAARRSGLGKDFNEDLNARQRRIVAESWTCYLKNSPGSAAEAAEDFDTSAALSMLSDAECRRTGVYSPRPCSGLGGAVARWAACGFAHSAIAAEDGSLFSAGYSEKGQLGNGGRCPNGNFARVSLPLGLSAAFASGDDGARRALLACGLNHTAVVTSPGGQLFTWGLGVFGQLGLGHHKKECCVPGAVDLPAAVVRIACGDNHTVALTADGDLFTFGHRDAVGGQSHHERCPEKKHELCAGSGDQVAALYAGGAGSFATLKAQGSERHPSLHAWGYNQRFQLGRYMFAALELLRPGPVALPPLSGASVRAFGAGSSHCVAVLDAPSCCVLPPDVGGEPCFGNAFLLAALQGEDSPHDVRVVARECGKAPLGAHRCILRARCPPLAARLRRQGGGLGAEGRWELDLRGHSQRCVAALLEYLYTDHCRMGADVGAELRALAGGLGLQRLMAGVAVATETDSVAAGMRWVRTSDGRWEEQAADTGAQLEASSTYARDLEALVVEGGAPGDGAAEDYVELTIRQADEGATRTLWVARPLLLTVDFFRAFLEGGFAEAAGLRGGAPRAELTADNAAALVLCLRVLATGSHELLPDDPMEALAVLAEAHRLQLPGLVAAAESALGHAAAAGRLDGPAQEALAAAAELFDLPRLARGAGPVCAELEA